MPKAIFGLPNHQECPCGDYVSKPGVKDAS